MYYAYVDENGDLIEEEWETEVTDEYIEEMYGPFDDSDGWEDDSNISCSDCPDDECTGHCMSCAYRPV